MGGAVRTCGRGICGGGSASGDSLGPQPTATYQYAIVGGKPLELCFWKAKAGTGIAPVPLVIFIHGGGWAHGKYGPTKRKLPQGVPLLEYGYAVASVQYRLTSEVGKWGGESVTWPAQAHDVKASVRWLRGNADMLNVDPNKFISFGESSGGHLSAILGTTAGVKELEGELGDYTSVSSTVNLCVDFYGPSSLLTFDADRQEVGPPLYPEGHTGKQEPPSTLLGSADTGVSLTEIIDHADSTSGTWANLVQLARTASPVWFAAGNEPSAQPPPPTLIMHGDRDAMVPFPQSQRLHEALHQRRVDSTFEILPGAGHGDIVFQGGALWPWDDTRKKIHVWMSEHLIP